MRRNRFLNMAVVTVVIVALSASISAALLRSSGAAGGHGSQPHGHSNPAPAVPDAHGTPEPPSHPHGNTH